MSETGSVDARRISIPLMSILAAIPTAILIYTTFFAGKSANADGQTTANEALRRVELSDQRLIESARQLSVLTEQVSALTILQTASNVRLEEVIQKIEGAVENVGENRERLIRIETLVDQ